MKKLNISQIVTNFKKAMIEHSPEILTGIGIAGMITTTVMAVKATPKALDILEEIQEKEIENKKDKAKQIVTKIAPVYIPSVVVGAISITCLISAQSVNLRRNAALAAAYTLSENTLKEYQAKVVETIGEKKEQSIRDDISKDKLARNPVSNSEIYITKKGDTLFYDAVSARYFKSDIDQIKRIVNDLNYRMMTELYISMNEFYGEIGLSGTKNGDDLGWDLDHGLIEIKFSAQISDDGCTPCIVIDYDYAPRYDYRNLR